ncbi:Alpha/Beta hydrolase protein [Roridomyces roridus]|uniref:Alpha/Beta hydrolase protein n=1 Tax=Roridomyces roridus TaxID=1738132 RepID=A0AAD7FKC3_9AGAR|nr:Alpha/Beta hydrolase protein [Roridomyces roridus]
MSLTLRYLPYAPLLAFPLLFYAFSGPSQVQSKSNLLPGPVQAGLASQPHDSRAREVYSEDWTEGGAYAHLPTGKVRYWLLGLETGKKIVLVHGLTIPAIAYAKLVPLLVEAGYRVLLYDLYGRGYSDAPQNIPYDINLYVTQLALLLQHVGWNSTRIVGYSMGGPITAAFLASFLQLVERDVVLIASAGASETPPPGKKLWNSNLPVVQRWITRKVMARVVAAPNADDDMIQEIVRVQATSLPGYPRAVASSLYDGPIFHMRWAFKASVWSGRRVLFLHGERDAVVPPAASPLLRSLVDSAGGDTTLVQVQDAGHDLTWTHPEEVGRALLSFLEG